MWKQEMFWVPTSPIESMLSEDILIRNSFMSDMKPSMDFHLKHYILN